jgi:hypothetical protein
MNRLIWLHDESLGLPADCQDTDLVVYVWDSNYFNQQQWSLKRQIYIYETLCQMPVTIFQGESYLVLTELCQQHGLDEICVQQALDPILQRLIDSVAKKTIKIAQTPYPQLFSHSSLKPSHRFHAYWKQVAPLLDLKKTDKKWH